MKSDGPLIQLDQVRFTYGADRFAMGVEDLCIQAGEIVACMGPSGSGKTTLLELIAGLQTPQSGRVLLEGKAWPERSPGEQQSERLQGLGLVFQGFELLQALTVEENVMLPLRFLGCSLAANRDHCQGLLQSAGIESLAHQKPGQLSFGERQRAAICRALITRPRLILADEPTANLDRDSADRVLDMLIEGSRASGTALFLISHEPEHASRVDRVLTMDAFTNGAKP